METIWHEINGEKKPFVVCKKKSCSYCKENIKDDEEAIILQCEHILHFECSAKMMFEKFGDEVYFVSLDKQKIFDVLESEKYNTMWFGTKETSGIIHCPECNVAYSILSPIYKKFGVPKKIIKIVVFDYEPDCIMFHLCTNIDFIHLLKQKEQIELLQNFSYENEEKCFDNYNTKEDQQIGLFEQYDDLIYHAVLIDNLIISYFPTSVCPVCKNIKNNTDDILNNDHIMKHASLNDYTIFCNTNFMAPSSSVSSFNDICETSSVDSD